MCQREGTQEDKMKTIEKIQELLTEVEINEMELDIRNRVIQDILADLKDFAQDATDDELPGFQGAIEVVEQNYPIL